MEQLSERLQTPISTAELERQALGASANATTFTADLRGYLRAFGQHRILAARVAAGVSSGDPRVGRTFLLAFALLQISILAPAQGPAPAQVNQGAKS